VHSLKDANFDAFKGKGKTILNNCIFLSGQLNAHTICQTTWFCGESFTNIDWRHIYQYLISPKSNDMALYGIYRTNAILTLVLGCPANLFLIWLIQYRTSSALRIWRYRFINKDWAYKIGAQNIYQSRIFL
jgi:hypothetical protein